MNAESVTDQYTYSTYHPAPFNFRRRYFLLRLVGLQNAACYPHYVESISVYYRAESYYCVVPVSNHSQFGSIDSLCFYGTYPLSGGYMYNGGFFFAYWLVSLFFFGLLILVKEKVRNFFRVPCSAREAEHIWLWVPLEEEVQMKSATPLVALLRAAKRATATKHGYEVTAPVLTTVPGTRYFELQASR
jgi:hypothetical protein